MIAIISRVAIIQYTEVIDSHHLAGAYDYMLKVLMEDTGKLEVFLSEKLKFIQGVQKSNILIILSTLKNILNR